MHLYLHKKMDNRIVSTAVLALSRQQEEFLARYRTYEAQKAYFESYGLGVTPFFRGGGGSHIVTPPSPEPELPYDYEVEYIEKNSAQNPLYINSPVIIDSEDFIIEIDFMCTSPSTWGGLYSNGYNGGRSIVSFVPFHDDNSTRLTLFSLSNIISVDTDDILNKRNNYILKISEKAFFINEKKYDLSSGTFNVNKTTIGLFHGSQYNDFYSAIGRLYSFKCIKNGDIICNMIPVSVDRIGYMYDKVSGNLFAAQGVGSFLVGPRKE